MAIHKQNNIVLKPIGSLFRKFHLLIFFIFIAGCLAASVILLNKTLTESTDEGYTSGISAGSIDQGTLDRIQSLHSSSQPTPPPVMPEGRVNPFAE